MTIKLHSPKPTRRRHPALIGWPEGTWCPAAVGSVPGYPATQTAYDRQRAQLKANSERARAAGLLTRQGVPNGWSGQRKAVAEAREEAPVKAQRIVARLYHADRPNTTDPAQLCHRPGPWVDDGTDQGRFERAMQYAIAAILSPTTADSDRTAASRLAMRYLAPPPETAVGEPDAILEWLESLVRAGGR